MPGNDFEGVKFRVPVTFKVLFCESVAVDKVCKLSVDEFVVFVADKPTPDCTILFAVAFVRFVNEMAELLSEYTFLYMFDILVSSEPEGELKYFTPLRKEKESSPNIPRLLPA